jgi:hypothetical protein
MGQARRRQQQQREMRRAGTLEELDTALRDMERVGGGVWQVNIYSPEAVTAGLIAGCPDDDLVLDLRMLRQAIERIEQHRGPLPPLCLLCSTEFSRHRLPRLVAILRPQLDALRANAGDGCWGTGSGICADCANAPDLPARVLDVYRTSFMPNARAIQIGTAGAA